MKRELFVYLERQARKSGGDRYTTRDGSFTIYIPQTISRGTTSLSPHKMIKIIFETQEEESA